LWRRDFIGARDPAEAIEILDLLLKFFGNGERWVKGRLSDRRGRVCVPVTPAGALSGDELMMESYKSGVPHMHFAKANRLAPADATKQIPDKFNRVWFQPASRPNSARRASSPRGTESLVSPVEGPRCELSVPAAIRS
jgi:hypothetical protein